MMLQGDNILEVQKVSKFYARKRGAARRRVGKALWRALTGRGPATESLMQDEFSAVKKVSFSLARGEALGIIGLNGSGKTTLLRMLAGQILPDTGEIRMVGESAAMIDLTAGFQMRASGRENVFLRGAMLGRSRAAMEAAFDEIVAFAELEEAIDAPVATYSSGMLMRLAFAIMIQMDPDILFIDETLSVGDFAFRQKCLGRLRELRERTAFVLVSHSMGDVTRFCDRVVVLQKGAIVFEGNPLEAVRFYQQKKENPNKKKKIESVKALAKPKHHNLKMIQSVEHFWADENGNAVDTLAAGKPAYFRCRFFLPRRYRALTIGLPIYSEDGFHLTGLPSKRKFVDCLPHKVGWNEFKVELDALPLSQGIYYSEILIRDGPEYIFRMPNKPVKVIASSDKFSGAVSIPYRWNVFDEDTVDYLLEG